MKGSAEIKDYRFTEKNKWRRRVWREIADALLHVGKDPKRARVIGLMGSSGEDVQCARLAGFSMSRMVSVDQDKRAARRNRRHGITTVAGTLCDVILLWDSIADFDVIYADTCGTKKAALQLVIDALLCGAVSPRFVFMANMVRGRESRLHENDKNQHRGEILRYETALLSDSAISIPRNINIDKTGLKVEGVTREMMDAYGLGSMWDEISHVPLDQHKSKLDFTARNRCLTYRSGRLNMDSVVMSFVPNPAFDGRATRIINPKSVRDKKTRRSIIAARAVHTLRMQ